MALLTNIDGIPLYSTIQEALAWGELNGLEGFHTHEYNGQTGYMGGASHGQAVDDFDTLPEDEPNFNSFISRNTSSGY